ncbi:hypothetical protein VdG1_01232 [Verticillium dahliae VDG1]|nr:hypothetical protein VdG1_01232 [Verticillium dahliae VDG1]
MAAPANITIKNLSGKWQMNKTLSDSPEPALALQGIGWMVRKAVGLATLTLHTATGGVKGTTENRCLDLEFREHADWLFGSCRGQSDWRSPAEIEDEFLKKGWLEGDAESTGPQGKSHVCSHVENVDNGWTATQIWGFQEIDGQRRYARNIVVAKDDKKVEFRLVYDYLGENDAA